jgi:hypothetical protein
LALEGCELAGSGSKLIIIFEKIEQQKIRRSPPLRGTAKTACGSVTALIAVVASIAPSALRAASIKLAANRP